MNLRHQLDQVDRISIIENRGPVFPLNRIFPAGNVWLKDDSRLHPVCGGSKVRRLEYLLAGLQKRPSVLTFGYESSNHALATAYFCATLGIPTQFVLQSGPAGMCDADVETTRAKMETLKKYASRVSVVDSRYAVMWKGLTTLARGLCRVTMIPAGGSSALGALGSLRSAFELSDQVETGEMPRPDLIFVPIGTGAAAVGLAVGVRAMGWETKVVAIRIARDKLNELPRLRKMAADMRRILPALSPAMVDLTNLELEDRYLGNGYGRPSIESQQAVTAWFDLQGIHLENTYSAKAAAALVARIPALGTKTALFWLTHGEFRHEHSKK